MDQSRNMGSSIRMFVWGIVGACVLVAALSVGWPYVESFPWEYKLVRLAPGNTDHTLKELGEEGWELVAVRDTESPPAYIFKRGR